MAEQTYISRDELALYALNRLAKPDELCQMRKVVLYFCNGSELAESEALDKLVLMALKHLRGRGIRLEPLDAPNLEQAEQKAAVWLMMSGQNSGIPKRSCHE